MFISVNGNIYNLNQFDKISLTSFRRTQDEQAISTRVSFIRNGHEASFEELKVDAEVAKRDFERLIANMCSCIIG